MARWSHALAAGLEAAAWWLRRRASGAPVLAAVGAGLAVGLLSFTGGPLLAAVLGLAGSALGLMSFVDAAQVGASSTFTHY
jgi:hypothetical protein